MPQKVLIVDDDPAVHMIVTPVLVKEGFDVVCGRTGEQGFQLALSERPSLIILDVIMPGIKGRELCAKIKAYDVLKRIPVIFLTAKNSPDDIEAELEAGAFTHLTKPIDSKKLVEAVKAALS